jgi:hypothetical protein
VGAEAAADIEAVAPGDHDVEQEEGRDLPLGLGDEVDGSSEDADGKTGSFEMVLNQAGDICVIFENEYCLAQPVLPLRRRECTEAAGPLSG